MFISACWLSQFVWDILGLAESSCLTLLRPFDVLSVHEKNIFLDICPSTMGVGNLVPEMGAVVTQVAEPWIASTLHKGYCIPFLTWPPLPALPVDFLSYWSSSLKSLVLHLEISKMLKKEAVEVFEGMFFGFLQLPLPSGEGIRS